MAPAQQPKGAPPSPAEQPTAASPAASGKATVLGPVASIDGEPVDRVGDPIELAPGCHVLRTDRKFIASTSTNTLWYDMPAVDFALPMRAGYNYYIERQILEPTGQSSPVRFTAYEREPSGRVIRTFAPVRGKADLDACVASAGAQ